MPKLWKVVCEAQLRAISAALRTVDSDLFIVHVSERAEREEIAAVRQKVRALGRALGELQDAVCTVGE